LSSKALVASEVHVHFDLRRSPSHHSDFHDSRSRPLAERVSIVRERREFAALVHLRGEAVAFVVNIDSASPDIAPWPGY
jgi:hypothetical protein